MSTPAVWLLLVGRIGLYLALVWFLVWAFHPDVGPTGVSRATERHLFE